MKTMPLRRFLTRLIWLCILPLIVLAVYLAFDRVRQTQAERDLAAANLAKNFATAVDSELSARISGLQLLAASPLADEVSRHQDLYRQAQGFVTSFGSHVVVADPQGQMLLNTRVPFGTALPKLPRPAGRAAAPMALETGVPAVGDIFFGPVVKQPLVAIVVPGKRQGKVAFLALSTLEASQFQKRLDLVALPPDWSLALLDGTGAAIAQRGPHGLSPGSDVKASARFVVKSKLSAWSVQLEISPAAYRLPLLEVGFTLALFILAATLIGLLGGTLAGRHLSRTLAALALPSEPGAPLPSIEEVAAVRRQLDAAANDRAAASQALRASEQRLREDLVERKRLEQHDIEQLEQLKLSEAESHRLLMLAEESRSSLLNALAEQRQVEQKIHEQLDELMRWQAVMIGREERVQQLKAEVNEQLGRQGEPARYASEATS